MEKVSRILCLVVLTFFLLFLPITSMAAGKYKKYDDFESYPLAPFTGSEKFDVSDGCSVDGVADLSIESFNGSQQLKFVYNTTVPVPNRSCWAVINTCPERIVGIKADVTVFDCAPGQDCRARVAWHRGITQAPENLYVWEAIQVRPNQYGDNWGTISSSAGLYDHTTDPWDYFGEAYWARFSELAMLGETFTVTADFSKPYQVSVTAGDQGTMTYNVSKKDGLTNPVELFKAIGMRVNGEVGVDVTNGVFVVYYDNIAIKTKGACDKKKPLAQAILPKKNLPVDSCSLDIKFNEPMNTCCSNVEADPLWGPITSTAWSRDRKTFTIDRDCMGDLPSNTKLNFVVNPTGGMDYFIDLAGNPAKNKKLTTKTE